MFEFILYKKKFLKFFDLLNGMRYVESYACIHDAKLTILVGMEFTNISLCLLSYK